MSEARQVPCFYVLAGVNGAGKSTIAGEIFRCPKAKPVAPKGAKLVDRLERAIAQRCDYTFHTPLGKEPIAMLLERAASTGIDVRIWYVGLSSPDLHIARIQSRVATGGKDVCERTIREAYDRSRRILIRLLPSVTELHLYDNSEEADPATGVDPHPRLLLHVVRGIVQNACGSGRIADWARPIIEASLRMSEQSAS